MKLPDIEIVSAQVHASWIDSKRAQGVTTRKAEDGEELMAPYQVLSEKAKELDRGTVKAVYAAIEQAREAAARAHINALMSDGPKPEVLDAFARTQGYANYQHYEGAEDRLTAYDEARDTAHGR